MIAVVAGALASKAYNGGEAWTRMSWVRGLQRCGAEVWFLEQRPVMDGEGSDTALAYFDAVVEERGLHGRAAVVDPVAARTHGAGFAEVLDAARSADLLLNISGNLTRPDLLGAPRRRLFLDLDPGFTQVWAANGLAGVNALGHDAYFTVGELIGTRACAAPTAGVQWQPTRPCVDLDDWPVAPVESGAPFTTISSWRGAFGPIEWNGQRFGVKAHEWRRVTNLPSLTDDSFVVALDIHPGDDRDRVALVESGWKLVEPSAVDGLKSFRRFVTASAGEFSVASGVYVGLRTGWFSDRSVRYLATGRPAIVQDTGWTRKHRVSEGVRTFATPDEAAAAVRDVRRDLAGQCEAARAIAERLFAVDVVVPSMLDTAGVR